MVIEHARREGRGRVREGDKEKSQNNKINRCVLKQQNVAKQVFHEKPTHFYVFYVRGRSTKDLQLVVFIGERHAQPEVSQFQNRQRVAWGRKHEAVRELHIAMNNTMLM